MPQMQKIVSKEITGDILIKRESETEKVLFVCGCEIQVPKNSNLEEITCKKHNAPTTEWLKKNKENMNRKQKREFCHKYGIK